MIRNIVVGFDGSDEAREAAGMALEIAQKFEARVLLLFVVAPVVLPVEVGGADVAIIDGNRAAAEEALSRARGELARPGIAVQTRVCFGAPAEAICQAAEAERADLVVVGSRGRGAVARVLLGSVATSVSHRCPRPVLIVHPKEELLMKPDPRTPVAFQPKRILVGTDFSVGARAAVEAAVDLAKASGAELILAHVVPISAFVGFAGAGGALAFDAAQLQRAVHAESEQALRDEAARIHALGVQVRTAILDGPAALELCEVAKGSAVELVVVGSHGRTGIGRLLLGSVAENVVRHAPTAVLVIRQAPEASPSRSHQLS